MKTVPRTRARKHICPQLHSLEGEKKQEFILETKEHSAYLKVRFNYRKIELSSPIILFAVKLTNFVY